MSEATEYVITPRQTGAFTYDRAGRVYAQPAFNVSRCIYIGDRGQMEPVGWFYDYNDAVAFVEQQQAQELQMAGQRR